MVGTVELHFCLISDMFFSEGWEAKIQVVWFNLCCIQQFEHRGTYVALP